jgi:hypothetical protein
MRGPHHPLSYTAERVSPHNAQTLGKLGADLGGISTKGSLQAGLKLAFEMTNQNP